MDVDLTSSVVNSVVNDTTTYLIDVDLINDISMYYKKQERLTEKHNDLLCRIVGVSDDILREQLQEEYCNIVDAMSINEICIKNIDQKYINMLFAELANEFKNFYINQFITCDLIQAINVINKVDIDAIASKHRVRLPNNIKQGHMLNNIAISANIKFVILDYEGIVINEIGKGSNVLYIYNLCFDRFNEKSDLVGYPIAL